MCRSVTVTCARRSLACLASPRFAFRLPSPFVASLFASLSLSPQFPRRTYVGYTHDVSVRLAQHNRASNACKGTKGGAPWRLLAVVAGFDGRIEATEFEHKWIHHRAVEHNNRAIVGNTLAKRWARFKRIIEMQTARWEGLEIDITDECNQEEKRIMNLV